MCLVIFVKSGQTDGSREGGGSKGSCFVVRAEFFIRHPPQTFSIAHCTIHSLILLRCPVILFVKPRQVEFCKSAIYFLVLFMACSKCPQFPLIHKYFLLWCTFPRTFIGPHNPAYYLCQHTFLMSSPSYSISSLSYN